MSVAIGPRQTHGIVVRGSTYAFFPGNDTSGMNEAFHPKFRSPLISLFVVIGKGNTDRGFADLRSSILPPNVSIRVQTTQRKTSKPQHTSVS